jgi:hypothetical protein
MYGKIFASMYEGSMVGAGPVVFAVWGYCIARAEQDGTVLLNPVLLAPIIGTSVVEIETAINYLTSPDEHSKNPQHEGRRLINQTGYLYFVVSHEIYQGIKNGQDRRDYMREYMRRKRETNDSKEPVNKLTELTKVNPISISISKMLKREVKEGENLPFESEAFAAAWVEWKKFRSEIRKGLKPTTVKKQLAFLARLGEEKAIKSMGTSIRNGWQGLFEPEDKAESGHATKTMREIWTDCANRCKHWDDKKLWCKRHVMSKPERCELCNEF